MRILPTALCSACSALALPAHGLQQSYPGRDSRDPAPLVDCNGNGIFDQVDLASGWSEDCNSNLVPDECEVGGRVLLAESFESGPPSSWSFSGQWHVTSACPRPSQCHGSGYAYFGSPLTCSFSGGPIVGELRAPSLELPATAESLVLRYCSAYEGEGNDKYDKADVLVNGQIVDHVSPEAQLDWEERYVDLTPYAGQTVDIRFAFDATDALANDFLGWQVDNVRVLALDADQVSVDCNANGVPDVCEPDCNLNGVPDACDITSELEQDCQGNGIPDTCEIADGRAQDCNGNLVPDACDLYDPLDAALTNLATGHSALTSLFPNTFEFEGGLSGACIADPAGMLDCGNQLHTNLSSFLPYTGGNIVSLTSDPFGPLGRYFTVKYPGIFILAADNCELDWFRVDGANGAGPVPASVDSLDFQVQVWGEVHTVFVKRVYGGSQPSVNQLVILRGDGAGFSHSFPPSDPESSFQQVDGLGGVDRLLYVLVSRFDGMSGLPLRHVDAREIAIELLRTLPVTSRDDNGNGVPDECD